MPGTLVHALLLCALLLAGCGDEPGPVGPEPDPVPSPDLDAVFAPATEEEIAAVRADWAARDVTPVDAVVEATESSTLGGSAATLRVVSHAIEGGAPLWRGDHARRCGAWEPPGPGLRAWGR